MEPIDEKAASGLGARIVGKINEIISSITSDRKADAAWKADVEWRLGEVEKQLRVLQSRNHGLKSSKGKAIAAQRKAEEKLEEARRLLN